MTGIIPINYNMPNFSSFFGDRWMQSSGGSRDVFKIDVKETNGGYIVEADLPGVKKSEIDLKADEKMLTISVNREEDINEENDNYVYRERKASSTSRGVRLAGANYSEVHASLEDGVLTVTVPKKEKLSDVRKIEIQ